MVHIHVYHNMANLLYVPFIFHSMKIKWTLYMYVKSWDDKLKLDNVINKIEH